MIIFGCHLKKGSTRNLSASEILGNPDYVAMSYGGYRQKTRDQVPSVAELKEDMKILHAMGVRILRTYNTHQYAQASNLLQAIRELKDEDPDFEMYVMLGTWIDCKDAWTNQADHSGEDEENNSAEIMAAVEMVNNYPDIVKIIAVGNEAMVHWATNYFVSPTVIYKWVKYLQDLKKEGKIPVDTYITSSDNYESWGGGDPVYRTSELAELIKVVDYVSIHVYPFHESYYRPDFWMVPENETDLSDKEKIKLAVRRATERAVSQIDSAREYIESLGIEKKIHIGETGWATTAGFLYGGSGSRAADEYKEKLYYDQIRNWANESGMSCFYFEMFDEQWKDPGDEAGSENHFGLINLSGQAKYVLWDRVDEGTFEGLTRNGMPITKTYNGDTSALLAEVLTPPSMDEVGIREITDVNASRQTGEEVTEDIYLVAGEIRQETIGSTTFPSAPIRLNAWEGTCSMEMNREGVIKVTTGTGAWWGCALEIQSGGRGENLSAFSGGSLHFDIKGDTKSILELGFQTGRFLDGTQSNNFITFGPKDIALTEDWKQYSIEISRLNNGADFKNITSLIYFRSNEGNDGKNMYIRNIYYTK